MLPSNKIHYIGDVSTFHPVNYRDAISEQHLFITRREACGVYDSEDNGWIDLSMK